MNRPSRFLIQESTVLFMIVLNAGALFFNAFPVIREMAGGHDTRNVLFWIDYLCVIYFLVEAFLKIRLDGWKTYWLSGWNRFDFLVVLGSMPSLLDPWIDFKGFSVILVLRLARLFRFFRVFRFIPNGNMIWDGIVRALRVSVAVMMMLFTLNLIFGLGATMLFSELPNHEKYFGDPITSMYSMFKVFTVEGWYNVPDELAEGSKSMFWTVAVRTYFVVAVIVGGVVGLSLTNAVFVNEVTAGNTHRLAETIQALKSEIERFREQDRQERADVLEKLQAENSRILAMLEDLLRNRGP